VIEESERADLKAATVMAERLARCFRSSRSVWCTGGSRRRSANATMRAFRDNAVHILVATSVIEVGST